MSFNNYVAPPSRMPLGMRGPKKPTFVPPAPTPHPAPISQPAPAFVDDEKADSAQESYLRKQINSFLVETEDTVEVQQNNPLSPLYSVKTFEDLKLDPNLLRGVYDMNFRRPSKIQETTLPSLLASPPINLIAQSQSGTGKTAAFILACLSRVDQNVDYPQVIILSPTYELAVQTGRVAERMAKHCKNIKFAYAIRGKEVQKGIKVEAHVIIGTPGKLLDWATRYRLIDMSKIIAFVLDEADVMIDTQGHHDQSIRIHKLLPTTCQMMLFSATYTEEVMDFASLIIPNPVIHRLKQNEESLETIKQYYMECPTLNDKFEALVAIFGLVIIGQTIIFCKTKKAAHWLATKFNDNDHQVGILSGDLTVEQRLAVLTRFKEGIERVLVTTNVCARGIDIQQVTLIANFDLPMTGQGKLDYETYLHRIGRTGRFGHKGIAVNMIDNETGLIHIKSLEERFGRPITKVDPRDDVSIATKLGNI